MGTLIYDIFIAYHGTYNKNGSYETAKLIADYLKTNGFSVYLHGYSFSANYPHHRDTQWNNTWERINESRTFLLVINDNVPRKENNLSLGNETGRVSQIRDEVDRFNSLVKEGKRNKHDFNWFYCGNITGRNEQQMFLESLYNPLSDGHNNLILGSAGYEAIKSWLTNRLKTALPTETPVEEFHYDLPYNDKFIKVVESNSFEDAYNKANYIAKSESNNLIITIKLKFADIYNESFPFKDAYEKAKVLRDNSPNSEDFESNDFEFQLYHGDFIKVENDDSFINGYDYVKQELKGKHSTRRALLSLINTKNIVGSGDNPIPSYMLSQFQIRNDTLLVSEYFRAMEISEFFKINMGETYIFVKELITEITEVKEIFIVYHIFDAYISEQPKSSLYIPIMDRLNAQYVIIPAIKDKDFHTILNLLEDKLYSKIYNIYNGFESIYKSLIRFGTFDIEVQKLFKHIIEKCKLLEKAYAQSNSAQNEIIQDIEQILNKIIIRIKNEG